MDRTVTISLAMRQAGWRLKHTGGNCQVWRSTCATSGGGIVEFHIVSRNGPTLPVVGEDAALYIRPPLQEWFSVRVAWPNWVGMTLADAFLKAPAAGPMSSRDATAV